MDPFISMGLRRIKPAGLDEGVDPLRVGVALGSGIGGLSYIEANDQAVMKSGTKRISLFIPGTIINLLPGMVSINHGFGLIIPWSLRAQRGHTTLLAKAIQWGCRVMIAGGAESEYGFRHWWVCCHACTVNAQRCTLRPVLR